MIKKEIMHGKVWDKNEISVECIFEIKSASKAELILSVEVEDEAFGDISEIKLGSG